MILGIVINHCKIDKRFENTIFLKKNDSLMGNSKRVAYFCGIKNVLFL
jgi:hypothetical protein